MDRERLVSAARRVAVAGVDLLYPPRCVGCGAFGRGFLCAPCLDDLPRSHGEGYCANCSAPWLEPSFCPGCSHWDALDGARAAFPHDGAARRAAHALKYGRVRAIAPVMAGAMRETAEGLQVDVAFAVPLHASRRRSRGYNQAEVLLRAAGWPQGEGALTRIRRTKTQVGLGVRERRSNVGGAFVYRGPELTGASVLLADDVVTTGATANECARVLKDFGARTVHVVAFCRADPRDPHLSGA